MIRQPLRPSKRERLRGSFARGFVSTANKAERFWCRANTAQSMWSHAWS